MFALNEKVIYPGYGVAKVSCIVEKKVGGATTQFFELTFFSKEMTILIPMCNSDSIGIRRPCSKEKISKSLQLLSEPVAFGGDSNFVNWNKRNKEYQSKLRSGSFDEMCEIYRDLKRISTKKELSFGEKNLLSKTEGLLAEEIALVNNMGEEKTIETLRALF